jgi:hypothetical protein
MQKKLINGTSKSDLTLLERRLIRLHKNEA